MKVAHLTSVHKQNDNRIFYKECVTLANEGYDVTLIVVGGESRVLDGVNIISYPRVIGGRLKRMFKTSMIDMIKTCKKVDADIYHFHDPELIFTGLYLKLIGKKVIYDIHENNPASILSKPYIKSDFVKRVISFVFDKFERFVSNFFDALVTARPDISERFKHKNLIILRNFPILPNFSKIEEIEIKKSKPSVVFVGGMTQIRGINELLDAFERLDDYELWLLGPITEEKLKNRIESGCKNVKYFGIVEAYEVFNYINRADIGIITFLPVPNHLHTLATKPFEYMACGKPMIMSNFDYWQETFKESSLYVNPNDSNDILKAVEYLMSNRDLTQNMGELNQKLANSEYNWQKESQKLIDLYERLK